MYVIFPAEEVVFYAYGYRIISANPVNPPPEQAPVELPQNVIQEIPLRAPKLSKSDSRSVTNSSGSQKSQASKRSSSVSKEEIGKPSRVPKTKVEPPTKSKSQTPDIDDFFERAKSRRRLNTFNNDINYLQVPDNLNFKAKSAPSTPLTSRKFKSFETERHNNSSLNLPPSRQASTQKLSFLNFKRDKQFKTDRPSSSTSSPLVSPPSSPASFLNPDFLFLDPSEQQRLRRSTSVLQSTQTTPEKSPTKKKGFLFSSLPRVKNKHSSGSVPDSYRKSDPHPGGASANINKMATASHTTHTSVLCELTHPSYNEHLKIHNGVTFKLVKTVSDFTQHLSQIYEQYAEQLQVLCENFRKRNGELRKERPACPSSLYHTWETLLQEVEIDSQTHSDIASILARQVSRPLLERSFHRKIQSRKVFTHRESYETIISKTEEKLGKCRQDYKNAYLSYLSGPTTQSLSAYFDTHNAYVQQLHATNGMLEEYSKSTLPNLLQELEEIYSDLCASVSEAILQGAEVVSQRASDQSRRYEALSGQCRVISGPNDLAHLIRALPQLPHNRPVLRRLFNPPQPPHNDTSPTVSDGSAAPPNSELEHFNEQNIPPPLKNELVIDRLASVQIKPSIESLRKEATDLELQIKQINDSLDTLQRMQQRSLESNLFNKVNELQEDISIKRFDLRVAQIHLSAINAQKELFTGKIDAGDPNRERKMSASSQGSMKSKWLKAFKSLKTPPSSSNTSPRELEKEKKNQMYHAVSTIIAMRKNGSGTGRNVIESDIHNFQENTYKKITPCDVCSQVLRGHTRQGLKCRVCKMNVHVDCQDKATKCQSKSNRLLRRQKSTSEIDTRLNESTLEEESVDDINYFTFPKVTRQLSFKDTHSRVTYIPDEVLERGSTTGGGTRPFGQPLCFTVPEENGHNNNVVTRHSKPVKRTPSKASKK